MYICIYTYINININIHDYICISPCFATIEVPN